MVHAMLPLPHTILCPFSTCDARQNSPLHLASAFVVVQVHLAQMGLKVFQAQQKLERMDKDQKERSAAKARLNQQQSSSPSAAPAAGGSFDQQPGAPFSWTLPSACYTCCYDSYGCCHGSYGCCFDTCGRCHDVTLAVQTCIGVAKPVFV